MLRLPRRAFLAGGIATLGAAPALAQHAHHEPLYEHLNEPGRVDVPERAATQRVYDSPAPKAADPGRWVARAAFMPRNQIFCMGSGVQSAVHEAFSFG